MSLYVLIRPCVTIETLEKDPRSPGSAPSGLAGSFLVSHYLAPPDIIVIRGLSINVVSASAHGNSSHWWELVLMTCLRLN